ncbi:ABC1 protein, putative [Trypanosoma brucei brucei TREU927]|uniref:ABC1 protein, putative n=1 Tax=Trypanosoma brucei brucei (strain 927/4 GUTat10.1) TaxID=185431 RepID=Q389E8_TRYB2|nr:ABC1 protein, putative [Trypanosoma brucei brucei TREU927]EAN78572.1 ABC1 protein, putative [Trypanosoma brucei brucei TREU927]
MTLWSATRMFKRTSTRFSASITQWLYMNCRNRCFSQCSASMRRGSRALAWGRRMLLCAVAVTTSYVFIDYATAQSITRSMRALITTARVVYMYKGATPETSEERSNLHRAAALSLLNLCLRNEGLYIKLGQSLTAMNHILPWEYIDVLTVLLDRAPVVPLDEVRRIIQEETGRSCEELFVRFDPNPIASASIAQVHRALMQPSDPIQSPVEVCVKVQKPHIRRQVFWDLQTYRFVLHVLGAAFNIPVAWMKETVVEGIRREVDFSIEARNATRIRQDFADRRDLYVPEVYGDLVTPRLLVMEWVDGVKLVDVVAVREQFDEVKVLQTVFGAFGDMIFKSGFVHCDPHGANILVRPQPYPMEEEASGKSKELRQPGGRCCNPQVVLLDFGLCCPESERFRLEYALLLKAMIMQDMVTVRKIVYSWGVDDEKTFSTLQLRRSYASLHRRNCGEMTREEAMHMHNEERERIMNVLKREEQLPCELVLVGRSIDILHGVNRLYGGLVNHMRVFGRRAVSALGRLNTYEDIQLYLTHLVGLSNGNAGEEAIPPCCSGKLLSLFDPTLEHQRREEAAAVLKFRSGVTAAFRYRVWEGIISLLMLFQFELALLFLDAYHMFIRWYSKVFEVSIWNWMDARWQRFIKAGCCGKKENKFYSIR